MSIRNLGSEKRQPKLSPHTRLALSVIARAVKDIEEYDASLHRSAARFLNGSEEFYFWANVLEQDSNWLLRELHARLRQDSPRAFRRLSRIQETPPGASILGARTRSHRGTATRVQINQLRGQLKQLKRATRRARSRFSNVT